MNTRKIWVNAQDALAGDVLVAIDRGTHTVAVTSEFVVRRVSKDGEKVRISSTNGTFKTAYPTNPVQVWRAY